MDSISIKLSRDEAIVLFEWLSQNENAVSLVIGDEAERKALWALEGSLQKNLVEPFWPNWVEMVQAAKTRLSSQ